MEGEVWMLSKEEDEALAYRASGTEDTCRWISIGAKYVCRRWHGKESGAKSGWRGSVEGRLTALLDRELGGHCRCMFITESMRDS